jgi:hypothetical protein
LRRFKSTVFISYIRTGSGSFATIRESIQRLVNFQAARDRAMPVPL